MNWSEMPPEMSEAVGVAGELYSTDGWACKNGIKMNFTFNNGTKPFAIGDCMIPFNQTWVKSLSSSVSYQMTVPKGTGMPSHTIGTWQSDGSCGCGWGNHTRSNFTCAGLRLVSTQAVAPKTGAKKANPPITCPKGQKAVQSIQNTPENRCTIKYGSATQPWEQIGLICYQGCPSGYWSDGPLCWKSGCPPGMKDEGALCGKNTYVPHTYAIWPWDKCRSGYSKYGLECHENCKSGYKAYNGLVLDYCGQTCPTGWTDLGLTCGKSAWSRPSHPAYPASHLISEIATLSVLGAAMLFSIVVTDGADTGPAIEVVEGVSEDVAGGDIEPAVAEPVDAGLEAGYMSCGDVSAMCDELIDDIDPPSPASSAGNVLEFISQGSDSEQEEAFARRFPWEYYNP